MKEIDEARYGERVQLELPLLRHLHLLTNMEVLGTALLGLYRGFFTKAWLIKLMVIED